MEFFNEYFFESLLSFLSIPNWQNQFHARILLSLPKRLNIIKISLPLGKTTVCDANHEYFNIQGTYSNKEQVPH
jgi:hypothetical protein